MQTSHPVVLGILLLLLSSPVLWSEESAAARSVSFKGVGGASLAGTLQVPAGEGVRPAVVILAGSGPTDRDGNQPPFLITDLLQQIAAGLAEQGVVSLRYDKRGMYANRAELPRERAKLGEFLSWENFVGDAVAAVKFLREQPGVDPQRVAIVGHSEGGMLALEAARILNAEGHPVAALILLGTPGRTMDQVLAEQLKAGVKRANAPQEFEDRLLAAHWRIVESIRNDSKVPADVPPPLVAVYPDYFGKFLHSEFAFDPAKAAAAFTGPVLVINGAADIQVSPEHDAKVLDTALSKRNGDNHSFLLVPEASHNLKVLKDDKDPGFTGPVAPAAMERIKTWTAEQLKAK